jgi:hypothetical protein
MKPDRTDEVSKKETNSPLLTPKENTTLTALSVHTISTPAFVQEIKINKPQILIKQELSFPIKQKTIKMTSTCKRVTNLTTDAATRRRAKSHTTNSAEQNHSTIILNIYLLPTSS